MFTPKTELCLHKLTNLINDAQKLQWSPETKIDWNSEIKLPQGIDKATYVDMVSQLYYAEEATIRLIGEMLIKVPDFQAKQYLCTQAIDEARHAQVYRLYLEKLGDIAPINQSLKALFESGFQANYSYYSMIIALNIVMEGEALNQQNKRIETLPCPLFRQVNKAIVRDEARHAAFGRIYMREKLPEIDSEEKEHIFKWIKQLWFLWREANKGRYTIDGSEIMQTSGDELDYRWQYQMKVFDDIKLCSVPVAV